MCPWTNKTKQTKQNTIDILNSSIFHQTHARKTSFNTPIQILCVQLSSATHQLWDLRLPPLKHARPRKLPRIHPTWTVSCMETISGLIIPSPPPYCMHKSEKETKTLGGVALPCAQIPLQLLAYNSQLTSAHQNWETKTQQSNIVRHILHSAHPASLTARFLSKRPLDEARHQGDRSANEFLALSLFPPLLRATKRRIMPIISLKKKQESPNMDPFGKSGLYVDQSTNLRS